MPLFLQLHRHALADARAVFLQVCGVLLPALSQFILLMVAQRRDALARVGARGIIAEDAENGALTTGHNGDSV